MFFQICWKQSRHKIAVVVKKGLLHMYLCSCTWFISPLFSFYVLNVGWQSNIRDVAFAYNYTMNSKKVVDRGSIIWEVIYLFYLLIFISLADVSRRTLKSSCLKIAASGVAEASKPLENSPTSCLTEICYQKSFARLFTAPYMISRICALMYLPLSYNCLLILSVEYDDNNDKCE